MTFEERHYTQLLQLEQLADDIDDGRRRRSARLMRGSLLVAIAIACLIIVVWLVHAAASAFYPISLGAIAGAMLSGGVIELLCAADEAGEEPSSWSSDPA